ncbi:hypothetical protein [Candidatus Thiodiazotropha sp. CDECU1]|uniref:hypothetical protein n=1 Tax=Candidatus Thiodiazotropha sp. CDECU1 TaxID=3065865 RepID=UPI0029300022|nr:hypothetical protein [Candidatus Thiodiazotropha sp. CDECU1]
MDPVSKLTRLLEALRLQQTGSNRANKATASIGTKRSLAQKKNARYIPEKPGLDQLSRRISERINRLPQEERESDKAVQLFIDSVLAWEFGEDLLDSGSFLKYSKQISAAIHNDSKLNLEFKLLLKSLIHTKK